MYSEHGFDALMRPEFGRRVPLVDRRVVLDARVGAAPRGLGDLAHQLARLHRLADRLTGLAGDRAPLAVVLDRAHELVGDADRVVGVLVLDRLEAVAVDRHVEARARSASALSSSLALHQMNSRMSGWSTSSTTILAARRVLPPDLIVPAHESAPRMNETGPEAVPPLLSGSIDPRMFERLMPEPEPPRKILPSLVFQSRIESIVSSTERMKQALHCGCSSKPDVEPDRAVEGRQLVEQDVGELGLEGVAVLGRREVAARAAPVGDRAGDAADHLLDRALARRRVELAAEVLLGDDVRRVLRPGLGELDVLLLERDPIPVADARVARLPLDGVERMDARRREVPLDRQRPAGLDIVGEGCLRGVLHEGLSSPLAAICRVFAAPSNGFCG